MLRNTTFHLVSYTHTYVCLLIDMCLINIHMYADKYILNIIKHIIENNRNSLNNENIKFK